MLNRNGYVFHTAFILIFLLLFIVLSFICRFPINLSFLLIFAAGVFIISFLDSNLALVILIFSMLLSPELKLGGIPGRSVVLRIDDILLLVIFLGWMAKMAVNKELGMLRATPLNKPILIYIFVCLLSTGLGILRGTTDPKQSIFYILKYLEYFIIFFMVVNNVKDRKQVNVFLFFIILTCIIVSIYAVRVYLSYGGRATAPFEGEYGEPNTFAGYLLLMMGITLGAFLYTRPLKIRILLGIFFILITIPFLLTLSRGGWLGFFGMYAAFMILTKRYRIMLLLLLLLVIMASPFIFPRVVISRYRTTFIPGMTYNVLGKKISIDESGADRVKSAMGSLKMWSQYPVLGRGIPGGGVVSDVQYTRTLREIGIIGFLAFIWIITKLFKAGLRNFRDENIDDFGRGFSLGFICGLMGLLTMGFTAEVFLIIRIMEPFWFLAAIVTVLPEIDEIK